LPIGQEHLDLIALAETRIANGSEGSCSKARRDDGDTISFFVVMDWNNRHDQTTKNIWIDGLKSKKKILADTHMGATTAHTPSMR